MNIKEIKEMVSLMNENGLVELEIEKDGMRIRLKKVSSERASLPNYPASALERQNIEEEAEFNISVTKQEVSQKIKAKEKTVEIRSPMVGTFYRAPSPEASPYVEVGQEVEPGQVICIIEAMKLMNEIKSEIKGKVLEILVENAEPVEFGQPLFLIEPT